MEALILAAGRGERLRPLTDQTPKPLLTAGHRTLVEYHIEKLVAAGIRHIVVNLAHLGGQIESRLGQGQRFGASITYSREPDGALETGGGIKAALELLGSDPFAVVNGDVYSDFDYSRLPAEIPGDAWILLVPSPSHHPGGDFHLIEDKVVNLDTERERPGLTFSGIGVYRRALFDPLDGGRFPLGPVLRQAAECGRVSGAACTDFWTDVGTLSRLEALRNRLREEHP